MTSGLDTFMWVVFPYVCLTVFAVGHFWRYRYDKFGWTTRSSQLYESRLLRLGSPLFHFGILFVFAGHVMGRADGATVWTTRVSVLIRDGDGEPNLLMVQMEDITAEHEAHEGFGLPGYPRPADRVAQPALDHGHPAGRSARREASGNFGGGTVRRPGPLQCRERLPGSRGRRRGDGHRGRPDGCGPANGGRVGRFGGDSFVIVVQDVRDVSEVERCAERVSASIAADLHVRGHRIVPTASIGIALSTLTSTPESLLRDTDSALFRAKNTGRGRWQFFDDAMHAQAVARLTVEDQLRDAITLGPVRGALPAHRGPRRRPRGRTRGTNALESPHTRPSQPRGLPGRRRGQRADHRHRRPGPGPGLFSAREASGPARPDQR